MMGFMPDSGAVRTARWRRHSQGDHSACRGDCRTGPLYPVPAEVQTAFPASKDASSEIDPARALRDLAVRLLRAHAADPGNASLAREARMTLLAIEPDAGEDPLDELRSLLGSS
jgi:hypothetical protein